MKFSFVVPTHNRPASLTRLLRSFSHLKNSDFEVVIVGNTNEDDYVYSAEKKFKKSLPIRASVTDRLGVNCARNAGVHLAKGSIIVFVDDDCYFEPHQKEFLGQLSSYYDSDPLLHILGGNYKLPPRRTSAATKAYHVIAQNWLFQGLFLGPANWCLLGGCLSVRRTVFENSNLFDESILFGASESEFVIRCLERGYSTRCAPEILITHDCRITANELMTKAAKQGDTTSRFPIFSQARYRLPDSVNFKEFFLKDVSQGALMRFNILRIISAYEANFGV